MTTETGSVQVLGGQQVLLSGLLAATLIRWSHSSGAASGVAIDNVQRTLVQVGLVGLATIVVLPITSVDVTRLVLAGGVARRAEANAFPIPPRDASVLALHEDVR